MDLTTKPAAVRRSLAVRGRKPSIQTRADGKRVFEGYAAIFYVEGDSSTEFEVWSGFVERIKPGAFDRAIRENQDVRALVNHEAEFLLGRTASGTLRLSVDVIGLRYEIDFNPEDPDHVRTMAKIERGDMDGSSFAFSPTRSVWVELPNLEVREIEDLDLFDVGPVTWPAYEGTTAGVRSKSEIESLRAEFDQRKRDRMAEADSVEVSAALARL
jgi:HK97 family phage prohead protease